MTDFDDNGLWRKQVRFFGRLRARWVLRSAQIGRGVCVTGPIVLDNRGTLQVGRNVTFLGGMIPTAITVRAGASMRIGEESLFNYGAVIEVAHSFTVGKRCMFASMVQIRSADGAGGDIVVGDDVWVAHGAVLSPGVTIGEGSVVAAGSVVVSDVPAHSLALGAPARAMPLDALGRRAGTAPDVRTPLRPAQAAGQLLGGLS
ncbi:MAG: acyltransferase [Nevskia sp.]|nr:acyltransferase [Nevskia sp.]